MFIIKGYFNFSLMKLAIFDIDWTIIKPKNGNTFPKNKDDWQWLVPSVLETIEGYHTEGYKIVFLTDQSKTWKVEMIEDVISYFSFEVTIIISMSKSTHKPNTSLFYSHITEPFDKKTSFYVGDALGRDEDWSSVDKDIAIKIGVDYYSPEDIFPIDDNEEYWVNSVDYKEIIIMVGYQGSGKSTLSQQIATEDYKVISGDKYNTPEKMIKEATKYIAEKSIIFDATNATIEKRAKYIAFAQEYKVPIRCIWINVNIDIAIQRIAQRVLNGGSKVPKIALYKLRKSFEEPTEEEGFELITV